VNEKKVAIITGSSRGIGKGIAQQLVADGLNVVINYANNRQPADDLVEEILASGGQAKAIKASVANKSDRDRLVTETLETYGRLDVLVNNAGITSPGRNDLLEATEESWDAVFETNLKGPFFLSQLAANQMIALRQRAELDSAQIINISSVSAYAVSTNRADYCIAKAGMRMMTHQFAARLAEENIYVYEVCPGVIASDMTAPVQDKYDKLIAEGLTPIQRWGQPSDIAMAVSAIVDGKFPFSTGEVFNVDGGFHLRRL
jgi:NAD(P)-dependent dehydrogenase (short-subunit alcohol dehydrogenase family)